MAREQMPVTPSLVTWARERSGLSLEQASEKFKGIGDWETGVSGPTYPQLEAMADAFKVPVAVFFFPNPPSIPPITESFRTMSEAQIHDIAPRIRLLLRKAKAFQISLAELNGGRNPAERLITRDLRSRLDVPASTLAQRVRDYIGISVNEQQSWPSAEVALENWRSTFAKFGVYVFKDAFRAPLYAGFCLYDREFPVIYVNNSSAKERQIFTLFHELAHLLFHTSGIDFRKEDTAVNFSGDARRIEMLCNRFAGAFLVPDYALTDAILGQPATEEAARQLAKLFNVSWLVVYRRFLDLSLVSKVDYEAAQTRSDAAHPTEPEEGGGNYYNTTMAYLGREFLALAMREYYQSRISEAQLADHLGVPLKNLGGIEDRFLRAQAARQ